MLISGSTERPAGYSGSSTQGASGHQKVIDKELALIGPAADFHRSLRLEGVAGRFLSARAAAGDDIACS